MNCKCGELFCPSCNVSIKPLNRKQAQIVKLIAEEKPLKFIGPELGIPRRTLNTEVCRIKKAIQAKNIACLVRFAVRSGLVSIIKERIAA
jgi:DNA-binding NarL/FixJ family response regulator